MTSSQCKYIIHLHAYFINLRAFYHSIPQAQFFFSLISHNVNNSQYAQLRIQALFFLSSTISSHILAQVRAHGLGSSLVTKAAVTPLVSSCQQLNIAPFK